MSSQDRKSQLKQWLQDNVSRYVVTESATLFTFDIDWNTLTGSFSAKFDGQVCPKRFRLAMDAAGKVECHFPMFHSPLGVPASYPAVDVPEEVYEAMLKGLQSVIPRLKPYGLDKVTGEYIDALTPLEKRLPSPSIIAKAKSKISNTSFSITVPL